ANKLLRIRRDRLVGQCAAEQRDEFAPPHGAYPETRDHGLSIAGRAVHRSRKRPLMSEWGQTLPSRDFCRTAALPREPDIVWRGWHVRKVPISDIDHGWRLSQRGS